MLKDLILRAKTVLEQSIPPEQELLEVENALSAYLEALATERIAEPVDFIELEHANRLLREVRRERSRRLAETQQNAQVEPSGENTPVPGKSSSMNISPQFNDDDTYDPLRKFLSSSHDPEADQVMDSAEEAFYAGNYQKAIPLYEKVLQIEPGWSRAREHHDEAEEFMRTGNIPSVALPPEAGKAYGKAQSAARVFRYQTALDYLDDAFSSLKEAGINRWREGEELRQDLENQMQAHEVYEEGLSMIRQGDLQGGLAKIQTAASAVALPEYVDKASEIRDDLAAIDQITDIVNLSGNIPADKLAESRAKLDKLSLKYGEIPQVSRLRNRMDIVLPNVVNALVEKIGRLKQQGDSATSLKAARQAFGSAEESLLILQALQPDTVEGHAIQAEIESALSDIQTYEDSLREANQALKAESRFFPRNAYLISKAVRARFPEDPEVLDLKRHLRWYPIAFYGGSAIAGILLILILWFGGRGIANAVHQRQLAMMPSPTITVTSSATPTITLTPTITSTPTPDATSTPDYTPTATPIISGTMERTVWVREGCYEGYPSKGRIPEGGVVTLISLPERVFDEFNRECVLVEYKAEASSAIGYVLLIDISIP